jgi:catechol 2,3-dioxygenase-like lactoylglutathione lyase family enzyme
LKDACLRRCRSPRVLTGAPSTTRPDVFDHVTIRVSDLDTSRRFFELALGTLGFGEPSAGGHFLEWNDFSISQAREDKPVTRNLHVAFVAASREAVDDWWRVMTDAGYEDDGPPGLRPVYREDYYGAFVLDPDGNSVEAVHYGSSREGGEVIDHLWIRVADLAATKRFYETIAPILGIRIAGERPERFHIVTERSAAFVHDGRPPTQNVHLAFPARDNATVDEFHRAALAAGYRENGPPGERPVYHAGYYCAFVLDPDGNNVEAVCHNR